VTETKVAGTEDFSESGPRPIHANMLMLTEISRSSPAARIGEHVAKTRLPATTT
jgi:hypothetical protein